MIRLGNITGRWIGSDVARLCWLDKSIPIELAENSGMRISVRGPHWDDMMRIAVPEIAERLISLVNQNTTHQFRQDALNNVLYGLSNYKNTPVADAPTGEISDDEAEAMWLLSAHDDPDEFDKAYEDYDESVLCSLFERIVRAYPLELKAIIRRREKYAPPKVMVTDESLSIPLLNDQIIQVKGDDWLRCLNSVRQILDVEFEQFEKEVSTDRFRSSQAIYEAISNIDPDNIEPESRKQTLRLVQAAKIFYP